MSDRFEFGAVVRIMGDSADPAVVTACARGAEEAGLDALWLPDHVAIPPDDAEGSNGRYLEVLATLAYLAAATERIALGPAVLVVPYRPALLTAKWLATIQELSGGRLQLGVGVGWMDAEFRALGLERRERGRTTDDTLAFLHACFEAGTDDVATSNGQPFLFRPRPPRPPILVGGSGKHALERAARYGEGWFPMQADPAKLAPQIEQLRELFEQAGKPTPRVACFTGVGDDAEADAARFEALREVGVTDLAIGTGRYSTFDEYRRSLDALRHARTVLGR